MQDRRALPPATTRVFLSFILPILGALLLQTLISILSGAPATIVPQEQGGAALLLAGAGAVSLVLGMRWYGLRGLGLRGGRPLYAGIGFAALGWIVYILARFYAIAIDPDIAAPNLGRVFFYLFLFEALALQLWVFGLLFRSVADWRGPLAAVVSGGLVFGVVGFLLFEEAFVDDWNSFLFFLAWGLFYGLIRLRAGSIIGIVIVQAMQSLTTWHILMPAAEPQPSQLRLLYAITATFYVIFIWRLWPSEEEDYRV